MAYVFRPHWTRARRALALGAMLTGPLLIAPEWAVVRALPQQTAADLFTPGLRWQQPSTSGLSQLPRSLHFTAGGQLLLAGGSLKDAGVQLLGGQAEVGSIGTEPLIGDDPLWQDAVGPIEVLAGANGARCFALGQFVGAGGLRTTRVTCYDAYSAAIPGAWFPNWSVDLPYLSQGAARWGGPEQGNAPWIAVFDSQAGQLHALSLDPATGALQSDSSLDGGLPSSAALFSGGQRFAIASADRIDVIDTGTLAFAHFALPESVSALAAGAGDDALWIGRPGRVELWRELGGSWSTTGEAVFAAPLDIPTALGCDDFGVRAVVGWWNAATGRGVRFDRLTRAGGVLAVQTLIEHSNPSSNFQDYPSAVDVSSDGRRAAAGRWGSGLPTGGLGPGPEAYLFDLENDQLLIAADLPGSALAVAIDATGERLAVAHKNVHANQFGSSGQIQLHATGESSLAIDRTPRPGRTVNASLSDTNAQQAWILLGVPANQSQALAGLTGQLHLDLSKALWVLPANPDAAGIASAPLQVPATSSLIGLEFGLQGATYDGVQIKLGEELLRPRVL